MRLTTVIALCLTASPGLAAEFYGGSQLLESCSNRQELASGYVAGWLSKQDADKSVMAATRRNSMEDKKLRGAEKRIRADVCMRGSVTATQATEVFCTYLQKDPNARRQKPGDALASALSAAWPCPDRN